MKVLHTFLVVSVCLLLIPGCAGKGSDNGGGGGGTVTTDNPVPVLTSITPGAALLNQPEFTLTARGSDFVSGAKIIFRGSELDTTWVSASELTALVTEALTAPASMDSPQLAVEVRVRNPSPGGGDSQSLTFQLNKNPVFGAPEIISGGDEAYWNGLTCDGDGKLYAWYTDNDSDPWDNDAKADVKVTRSDDYGDSWSSPYTATLAGCSIWPQMACDSSGQVILALQNAENGGIYFKKSSNHGQNWTGGVRVDSGQWTYQDTGSPPIIAATESGYIHMAFIRIFDMSRSSDFYARSIDGGAHWKRTMVGPEQQANTPVLAARDADVYILYPEHNPWDPSLRNDYRCFFQRSPDEGSTWQAAKQLSSGRGVSHFPSMDLAAGPEGLVAAAWVWGDALVRVRTSGDYGATWRAEKGFVANTGGEPAALNLHYDALGNLLIVWVEDGMIYFRRSMDNGATWSVPVAVRSQIVNPDSRVPLGLEVTESGCILVTWVKNRTLYLSRGTAE